MKVSSFIVEGLNPALALQELGTSIASVLSSVSSSVEFILSYSFELKIQNSALKTVPFAGGYGGGEPLVPIPNTTVKPSRAGTTSGATPREIRSPPAISNAS